MHCTLHITWHASDAAVVTAPHMHISQILTASISLSSAPPLYAINSVKLAQSKYTCITYIVLGLGLHVDIMN